MYSPYYARQIPNNTTGSTNENFNALGESPTLDGIGRVLSSDISEFNRVMGDDISLGSLEGESVIANKRDVIVEETQPPSEEENDGVEGEYHKYSVSELVAVLGSGKMTMDLSPELERRVRDFRLAQEKRRWKHGEAQRFGIWGMYRHLSAVRTDLEWAEDAAWRRQNGHPYLSWTDFDDVQQKGQRPIFTYFLVAACSIMLIVEFYLNGWKIEPLSVNPLIGPSAAALIDAGARDTNLIVNDNQWWRIITPLSLHAGIIHFFINMAALWFIGSAVEENHGSIYAVVLFFIPGMGGNILSAIFLPQYISVGASGGIFGLVGGCIADITLNWKLLFIKRGDDDWKTMRGNFFAIFWLLLDIVLNAIMGLTPYVDNFTHLGGLVYGLCCGWSTLKPLPVGFFGVQTSNWAKVKMILVRFLGLIVAVLAIVFSTVWLATADVGTNPCESCRYISCVEFPFWSENKWWYCDDCDQVTADLYKLGNVYDRVDLTCPNDAVETIDIFNRTITDSDVIRRKLPSLCREYCADVYN